MKKYDVAIIGAGTGGLSARKWVAKKTDNYVVIDNGILFLSKPPMIFTEDILY